MYAGVVTHGLKNPWLAHRRPRRGLIRHIWRRWATSSHRAQTPDVVVWVDFNAVFNKEAAVFLFSILLEMVFTLALNVFGNPVVLGRAHGKECIPRLPCKASVAGMLVLDPR